MSLSPEQQEYFEQYFALFETDGWRTYTEQALQNKQQIATLLVDGNPSNDETWFYRGQASVLSQILGLEEGIKAAHEVSLTEPEEPIDDETAI